MAEQARNDFVRSIRLSLLDLARRIEHVLSADQVEYVIVRLRQITRHLLRLEVVEGLRTFALIVSAHPYCARKFTCHAMPRHPSSARAKF